VRCDVEGVVDVGVVAGAVDALPGEHADAVRADEGGRGVVLGAERVRGGEPDLGTAGVQGAHQVRRLGGDVQAGGDPFALQRAGGGEAPADLPEHRHGPLGPLDALASPLRESEIGDVVRRRHGEPVPPVWHEATSCQSDWHEVASCERGIGMGWPSANHRGVISRAGQ
jgi:hypothetical protein